MLKSLQARLTLSYVALIAVVLGLAGLVALVLLRGYQKDLAFERLADRAVLLSRQAADPLRRGVLPAQLVDRLSTSDGVKLSLYLLDAGGQVVAGSNDLLNGRRFERLSSAMAVTRRQDLRGEERLAGGEHLLWAAARLPAAPAGEPRSPVETVLLAQPYFPARLAVGQLLPRLAWAGALALALSLLLAALMAYSIARPLERMARAAHDIAAGHYDQELEISAPVEVAHLAESLNRMARQVAATLQSQQDLVANVSHELKTPLTSIQGFSQALLDGTAADETARQRAAGIIYEEAGRMRRLVDELLDLARLETGQVRLAHEAVDVDRLLRDVEQRFAPRVAGLPGEEMKLELRLEDGLPPVAGDAERLEQVLGNLVDNALKHTRAASGEGRVVLAAEAGADGQRVILSVTDNGPGIPAEELGRIFERFYQVDKSRVRRGAGGQPARAGAGLGLAIAREIVQAHAGQIGVESVEGLGTRFRIELPAWRDGGPRDGG